MPLYWPHPSALVAYNGGTNVGHGPVGTLFLCLILFLVPAHQCWPWPYQDSSLLGLSLFLVPVTPCDTILYWLSPMLCYISRIPL